MGPSPADRLPRVVVAAVIRGADGRYLLSRRPAGSHLGGLWEFPGGGVEPGETPAEALVRELDEELGVGIGVDDPLTFAFHRDSSRDVVLLFYRARITAGMPSGRLGQEFAWFAPDALSALPTPPADAALVRLLAASPL